MEAIDLVILLLHPLIATVFGIWLYRHWSTIKAIRLKRGGAWSRIRNQNRDDVIAEHERQGRWALPTILGVILFAILANLHRYVNLDAEFDELFSLHGWLGITLAFLTFYMTRTGKRMVIQREEKSSMAKMKGIHRRAGDLMLALLVAVMFLGFLRAIQIIQP